MADNSGSQRRRSGVTIPFLFAVLVAAFGSGFQYGYNISVLNAPHKEITDWIAFSSFKGPHSEDVHSEVMLVYSIAGSIYSIGGLVGSLTTSITLKYIGLKTGILVSNSLAFLAVAFMGLAFWADTYIFFIVSRFVIGVCAGVSSGLVPMYLSAIAPISVRGAIGSSFQLFTTIGVVTAQILGLKVILGNDWPHLFSVIAVVAIFQVLGLLVCPDSPEFLYDQGRIGAARKALRWLRGTRDVEDELEDIAARKLRADAVGEVKLGSMLTEAVYRKPLLISCMLMLAQMFSGINAIMAYSTQTFEEANLKDLSEYGTVALGLVNVLMTIASLFTVDLLGRKILLMFSFVAISVDILLFFGTFMLAESGMVWAPYMCILFLVLFVAFYACGAGPIPWFIVSELFAQNARATAVTLAVAVHWISYFIVGLAFPLIQSWIDPYIFIIFFAILVLFSIYVIVAVPETRGKSIEEISAEFES